MTINHRPTLNLESLAMKKKSLVLISRQTILNAINFSKINNTLIFIIAYTMAHNHMDKLLNAN